MYYHKSVEDYYKKEIADKDDLLKDESKIIWKKYQDLHRFRTEEVLIDSINKFLSTEDFLLAIQFYRYDIMHSDNLVTFKINYSSGSVREKVSINSMMQNYYYVSSSFYERFHLALHYFDQGDIEHLMRFITDVKSSIDKKDINKLNEEDAFHYELLQYAIEYMIDGPAVVKNLIEQDKTEKLSQLSRLGIIRGIINKDFYFFSNIHSNHKKNRIYMTKVVRFNAQNYILFFSVDNAISRNFENYTTAIEELCRKFIIELSDFVEIKTID